MTHYTDGLTKYVGTVVRQAHLVSLSRVDVLDVLSNFDSEGLELSLELTDAASESKLFTAMPPEIKDSLTSANLTTNWHHFGVSPASLARTSEIPEGMVLILGAKQALLGGGPGDLADARLRLLRGG